MYDAVHLFSKALTDLDRSQEIDVEGVDCAGTQTWKHGNSLVNYMKLVRKEEGRRKKQDVYGTVVQRAM